MIGYRKKFVFIHIPKVAGKSVNKALRPYMLPPGKRFIRWTIRKVARRYDWDVFNITPPNPRSPHGTYLDHVAALGEDRIAEFYTFSFVRNPWDRMVSLRSFTQLRTKSPLYEVATNESFEAYCAALIASGVKRQVDYLVDRSGRIGVRFVGRFETLDADFETVCREIGIDATLPHRNKSDHRNYRKYYDDTTREMVAAYFRKDIEEFGYEF